MRTGDPAGHAGYFHEAAVYDTDEELLDLVVPHIEGGVAAGEPTAVALQQREAALVRRAVGEARGVTYLAPMAPDERPPVAIMRLTSLLGESMERGADQVRIVHNVPHPGLGAPWDGWRRCEAAVNHLLRDLPGWELCLYDRRVTPGHVLADVERTHPHLLTVQGHQPNDRYLDPAGFLLGLPPSPPDPLEAGPPALELTEPTAADSRRAVVAVAREARLASDDAERLVMATSESVANALTHGAPPVIVRAWGADERMVVTVSDAGQGPSDPYAGLVPQPAAHEGNGGLGLWVVNQLTVVSYNREPTGFTIRLVAGSPVPA